MAVFEGTFVQHPCFVEHFSDKVAQGQFAQRACSS